MEPTDKSYTDSELTELARARYAKSMDHNPEEIKPDTPEEAPQKEEGEPKSEHSADAENELPPIPGLKKVTGQEALKFWTNAAQKAGRKELSPQEKRFAQLGWIVTPVEGGAGTSTLDKSKKPVELRSAERRTEILQKIEASKSSADPRQALRDVFSNTELQQMLNDNIHGIAMSDPAQQTEYTLQKNEIIRALGDETSDLEEIRNSMRQLIEDTSLTAKETKGKLPNDIYELAEQMVSKADIKYKKGGKFEILTHEGKLNSINFLRLVRERMKKIHGDDPDNPVNFYSSIGVETQFRSYSIQQLLNYKETIFRDKDGNKTPEIEALHDALYYELWLFGQSRNNDADYRKSWQSDDNLPKVLDAMYQKDTLAKSEALGRILTMSGIQENSNLEHQLEDKSVGAGVREALALYFYLSDEKMLKKFTDEDSPLFSNKEFYKGGELAALDDWDPSSGKPKPKDPEKHGSVRKDLYDQEGKVISDKTDEYMEHFNIFNDINKSQDEVAETRERIKQHIMKKYNLTYFDADYAELFAHSMTRWTGIAAHNDTGKPLSGVAPAVGFDAWSKVLNTRDYRKRQVGYSGQSGDKATMFGIKKLGVTFWEGVQAEERDENGKAFLGRTLLEVLLGADKETGVGGLMKEEKIDLQKKLLDRADIKLESLAMRKFSENHIVNSFNVFHHVLEAHGMHLDHVVEVDQFGRVVFNAEAADKIFDGIKKYLRYAYGSSGKIPMDHIIRVWEIDPGTGKKVYKEQSIAESLFDREVLGMSGEDLSILDKPFDTLDKKEKVERKKVLSSVNKKVFMYLIAGEMYKHQDPGQTGKLFSFAEYQKIYRFLEGMIGELEGHEGDLKGTHVKKSYFTKEEIKKIRKVSKTEFGRLFGKDLAGSMLAGSLEGFKEAAQEVWKYVSS